ncbi:MAG: phenylalanine--tRNA ligase subunit beta [Gammaproteobacteria bacterium]|nr:MAG: phenylalanine--tRNA ligase subunit beta [Gammaproteobacteria bacterium]
MKISENWLRQWVNPNVDSDTLAEQLTMAGLELDDKVSVAKPFTGVVVGEVVDVQQHPDADKLRVTKVNIGQTEPVQIVCGAPNVRVGMKAPLATIGAVLPPIADKNGVLKPFKINKSKLRGVESFGMLCGASEIDLEDEVNGLLELPVDAPVGMDIREYLGLDNQVMDISITPNRGDCFSVRGISREISVINDIPVHMPDIQAPAITSDKNQGVKVEAVEACPRYLVQPVLNIDRSVATPKWMSDVLVQSGIRTHNFLVDVTNYVLMELGQPMHAFDADKLVGDIFVRLAKEGEKLTLLNDDEVTLQGDELVISDDKGVIALAGIMGGTRTAVTDSTTNIVLESAYFDQITIAGKARRFGLHTDASQRFERGVDFDLPKLALERATQLLIEVTGAQLGQVTKVEDISKLPQLNQISLTTDKVNTVLGTNISSDEIARILTQLGIEVKQTGNAFECTPPTWRFDISLPEDLVEEVARIYGYDNIKNQLPKLEADMNYDDSADLLHAMKLRLVDAGYMEAISFSFSDEKLENILNDEKLGAVLPLANPISSDLAVMRRTMLSSLLPCVQYNLNRQQSRVRFFETGLTFVGASVSELVQTPSMAIVAVGDVEPEQADSRYQNRAMDFYDLKHDVEQLLPAQLSSNRISYQPADLAFLHPGQSANLLLDGKVIGWLGQLHPSIAKNLDLPLQKSQTVWVAQLATNPLAEVAREKKPIVTPSKFPQVRRDLAILVDADIEWQTLQTTIREFAGKLLANTWLFDVYQGEHVPQGQRSLAFALVYQDVTQTLSDEVVNKITDKVIQALENQHQAVLRDS